jgi:hypothetical protein
MGLSEFIRQANVELGQDPAPLHDSGKESRIVQLLFGQSKLEGLSSSHPRPRKGRQRRRARERQRKGERDSEREGEVSPGQVSKGGRPWPASPSVENAQPVSQMTPC